MRKLSTFVFLALICMFAACQSSITSNQENEGLNDEQVELKSKMKQAALIVSDLVKDEQVMQEIQWATRYSLENGRDEDVTFSELFFEDAAYKQALKGKVNNPSGTFKNAFQSFSSNKQKAYNFEIDVDLEEFLIQNNLKIYWPYSENWTEDKAIVPTLSYHPVINEDENEGFKPNDVQLKTSQPYETVLVNDDYAYNNPTLLIIPCEEIIMMKTIESALSCGGGGGGGTNPPVDDTEPGEYDYNQVLLGSAQLRDHYDGIFAGGSETRWQLADAVKLTINDPDPLMKVAYASKNFSRKDIRKKYWKGLYMTMDDDWSDYELAKELYIWEGDEGDVKVDISLGATVKISDSVNGNFTVNVSRDRKRDDIYRQYMNRAVFYSQNRTANPGHGLKNGFRVRAAGDLRWTFNEVGIND